MLAVLKNRTYRHLFLAQVIALLGTGLATVALGLQAYELSAGSAGAVLGTALAIKMIAYVVVAPVATAFTELLPRRAMLVSLDLIRAAVALAAITGLGAIIAARLWPSVEIDDGHVHTDLDASHPHIAGAAVTATGGYSHSHAFVKDRHHRH